MLHPMLRAPLLLLALLVTACLPGRRERDVRPAPGVLDAHSVAIYRTLAESVYVKSTGQRIAVAAATLDTACAAASCEPLANRWGLDPSSWPEVDEAELRSALDDVMRRGPYRLALGPVVDGQAQLWLAEAGTSPAPFAATEEWRAFRAANGGAVGVLHFSPVGYSRSGRLAAVFVDWRCGATCGHRLSALLAPAENGGWRIAEMMLLPGGDGTVSMPVEGSDAP